MGGKPKLLGITKRGSKSLRKLVIQGARAALPALAKTATPLGVWLRSLLARAHGNTVVVALASKLIRIAWALLRNQTKGYGPHKTLYNRFIRWSRLGVFDRIFAGLAADGPKP